MHAEGIPEVRSQGDRVLRTCVEHRKRFDMEEMIVCTSGICEWMNMMG